MDIVRGGEGATKLITVQATGARTYDDFAGAARHRQLAAGEDGDPRRRSELGPARRRRRPLRLGARPRRRAVTIGDVVLFEQGRPFDERAAGRRPSAGQGHPGRRRSGTDGREDATMWTCDLSADHVKINAGDYSVPGEKLLTMAGEDFGSVLDRAAVPRPRRLAAPRRRGAVSASRRTTSRCSTSTPPASPTPASPRRASRASASWDAGADRAGAGRAARRAAVRQAVARTRATFEIAVHELGGDVIVPLAGRPARARETVADVARTSSAGCRAPWSAPTARIASSSWPRRRWRLHVINALTNEEHPCQAAADLLTLHERWDGLGRAATGRPSPTSATATTPRRRWCRRRCSPASVRVATPKSDALSADVRATAERAAQHGATLTAPEDPVKAVTGVDAAHTDVWTSMGKENEAASRLLRFRPYQVKRRADVSRQARCGVHALPAGTPRRRGHGRGDGRAAAAVFDQSGEPPPRAEGAAPPARRLAAPVRSTSRARHPSAGAPVVHRATAAVRRKGRGRRRL